MDWNRWCRPWCNRASSKLGWALAASLGVWSFASSSQASDPETPARSAAPIESEPIEEDDVPFGPVELAPNRAVTGPITAPPRRQLDERFAFGVHHRLSKRSGPEFRENRKKELIYRDPERRFRATLHADGKLSFRNRGMNFRNQRILGVYDMVLRAQGTERHQTAKRALLRETFEERLAMRTQWTAENLEHAEKELWDELGAIWNDERMSLEERKRILLQRWAECDVDIDLSPVNGVYSMVDRQRRTVARRAQRTIEHFVRTHVAEDEAHGVAIDQLVRVYVSDDEPPVSRAEQVVRVRALDDEPFNFHGALSTSRGGRTKVDAKHELAVSLAPDLFEECERDPAACLSVGDLLVGRRADAFDAERGADYYGRACDAGDPWACYELAVLHYLGLGVSRDDRRAARLHGVACDGGVAEGCAYLAHLHRRGLGVAQSETASAGYHRRACEHGLGDYCR
jgi:hypothetical protein